MVLLTGLDIVLKRKVNDTALTTSTFIIHPFLFMFKISRGPSTSTTPSVSWGWGTVSTSPTTSRPRRQFWGRMKVRESDLCALIHSPVRAYLWKAANGLPIITFETKRPPAHTIFQTPNFLLKGVYFIMLIYIKCLITYTTSYILSLTILTFLINQCFSEQ